MPCRQNIQCHSAGSIEFKTARRTSGFLSRRSVLPVHASTTAHLAGIVRQNEQKVSTRPCQLAGQLPPECVSVLIRQALALSRFGPDVLSWRFMHPGHRARHVSRFPVPDYDNNAFFADGHSSLVQKAVANIGALATQALNTFLQRLPAGGNFRALCQFALRCRQFLALAEAVHRFDGASIGKCRGTGDTDVCANGNFRWLDRLLSLMFRQD